MTAHDVAVVGAGIAGSAVAVACAQRGARVVLLDRGTAGGQASGMAAGLLAPCSETDEPGALLDAARASLELWPELAATTAEASGVDSELVLSGLLRVAQGPDDAAALRLRIAWQQVLGIAVEWLDEAAVIAAEPACAAPQWGAAWYPDEGQVHSRRAVRALVATAARLGVTVREDSEVVAAAPGGRLRLASGATLTAATVVVAAGPWSGAVAAALGMPALPIAPVSGQLVGLRGLPRLPRHVLFGGRLGYAVAKRDGLLLVGATEEDAGFAARVTAAATETLLATARGLVAGAGAATLAGAWAGLRPAAPDHLPVMGELGTLGAGARVLIASGHHRNGVLLAPVTGRGMARLALDGVTPPGWESFDPRRFL